MKLTITIDIGNAGMESSGHVAGALENIAEKFRSYEYIETISDGHSSETERAIQDHNGNTVGKFILKGKMRRKL